MTNDEYSSNICMHSYGYSSVSAINGPSRVSNFMHECFVVTTRASNIEINNLLQKTDKLTNNNNNSSLVLEELGYFISAHHTSVCSSHICSISDSPIIRLTSDSSIDEHCAVTASHSEPDLFLTYI